MSSDTFVNTHLVRWAINRPNPIQQNPAIGPNIEKINTVMIMPIMTPSM